jgi:hypothetical protein
MHLGTLLLGLLLLPAPADAKRRGVGATASPTEQGVGPTVVPSSQIFLRGAFDTDPSTYIGRFLPDSAAVVDESSAVRTRCSEHVGHRSVGGGNVTYDELFHATTQASLRVGMPEILGVGLGGGGGRVVRIQYTLQEKMVAEIEDPAAFEACCQAAPDQCTGRFVGEFYLGTGAVYYAVGAEGSAELSTVAEGVTGGLELSHGMAWQRSIAFDQPVYFAMRTTENPYTGRAISPAGCGDWVDQPPRSSLGSYFVGLSDPLPSERAAREAALLDARTQVVRWVEQSITSSSSASSSTAGAVGDLSTQLRREGAVEAASSGVASLVKDQNWCIKALPTPAGYVHVAYVLAFLPSADAEGAERAVLDAVRGR